MTTMAHSSTGTGITMDMYPEENQAWVYDHTTGLHVKESVIYLLHFDAPISTHHTCQHYIGWTCNLWQRLEHHRAGRGARLLAVARERGIGFRLVRTWPGDRSYERRLKARKAAPRLCPICNGTDIMVRLETQKYAEDEIPW